MNRASSSGSKAARDSSPSEDSRAGDARSLPELADAERQLRLVMDHAPVLLASLDRDQRYRYVNEAYATRYGKTPGEIIGRRVQEIVGEDVYTVVRENVERALAGETFEIDVELPRDDGKRSVVRAAYRSERDADGAVTGVVAAIVDITERKLAEERVRASEERYRTLFNSIDEGFCIIESLFDERGRPVDYRFLEVNPAFEKHTGFHDAQGRTMLEIRPDHEDHWFEIYGRIALTGIPERFSSEAKNLGRHFDLFAFRVGSPEERKVAVLFSDVTARVLAENALRESDRRKDEFLATLAHELRNPLAPIRTGLELMRLAKDDPQLLDEVRETMERQSQQMVRLIDDLLDVSRISRGKLELRPRTASLQEIVRRAVESVQPLFDEKRHRFELEQPSEPVFLHADPERLSQVLSNLLDNAAKYTPAGGAISLAARREGRDIVFVATDTGLGIPADMVESVFQMFTQVGRASEYGQKGLGIGLTLVKSIVEMHGGTISLESAGAHLGSRFEVRLPQAAREGIADEAPGIAAGPAAILRRRVLIADDNADAADALARMLTLSGHAARAVYDGQQALDVADEFRPDVALLDLGMPVLDGYETARRLRTRPDGRRLTLIALSGWGHAADKQRALEAGFDLHLTKPAEPAELQALLLNVDVPAPGPVA